MDCDSWMGQPCSPAWLTSHPSVKLPISAIQDLQWCQRYLEAIKNQTSGKQMACFAWVWKSMKHTNDKCMKIISRLLKQNWLIRSKSLLDNYVSDDHAVPVKCYTAGLRLRFLSWRINHVPYRQIHLLLFSLYSLQIRADKSVVSRHLLIVYVMPFSKVLSLGSVPLIR